MVNLYMSQDEIKAEVKRLEMLYASLSADLVAFAFGMPINGDISQLEYECAIAYRDLKEARSKLRS